MKETVISVVAIVALAVLGVFISYTQPEASKLLYAIAGIIGAIAGVTIPKAITKFRVEIEKWFMGRR